MMEFQDYWDKQIHRLLLDGVSLTLMNLLFTECEKAFNAEKPKTTWKPISELKEICKGVWLLDKDNNVGFGFLVAENKINYNLPRTPECFGVPVMFSEVKP